MSELNENKDIKDVLQNTVRDFESEILQIIRGNHPAQQLKSLLEDYHYNDVASILPTLSENERKRLYTVLDNETLAEIFSYLDDPSVFAEELAKQKLADIVEEMPSDEAVEFLEELDEDKKQEIIELLEEETAKDVELISAYSEDLIGSIMTNDFVQIEFNFSIKQAMREVIKQASDVKNITTIFVTQNQTFKGAIKLRDLVIARSNTPLEDITVKEFPFLYASDQKSDVIDDVKEYCEEILPVLDADNRLIGALTSSDVLETVEEDLQDTYAKLAGLTQEEQQEESVFKSVLKRLPWLIALLVLDLFIGAYVGIFEAVVIGLPFIVCFQQMISGMSGNAGTQSLAVTVRSISEETLDKKQAIRVVTKETRIGFINGIITGAIAFIGVFIYSYFFGSTVQGDISLCLLTGMAVALALLIATTLSSFTGSIIPMLINKLGFDPAVASGPLITTLNDLVAITVYYGMALLIFTSII